MRARLPQIAAACFVAGCALLFLTEGGIGRIVSIPLIFAGIALGVVAIVSPDFLEADRES